MKMEIKEIQYKFIYQMRNNKKGENMSKKWWKAAGIRALKTVAQTAASMITIGAAITEIDWLNILSVSLVAGIYSLITNIGGLPELKEEK